MKVLFLSNSIGGLRCFRYELIETLTRRKDTVYIASNIEEDPVVFSAMGCEIEPTPMNLRGTNLLSDVKLLFSYIKLFRRIKPDVVLTYTIKPNVYGGMACRFLHIKQIASVTGLGTAFQSDGPVKKIATHLYKIGLKKCAVLFFQNKECQDVFQENKIAVHNKKEVIAGSGVNLNHFQFSDYPADHQPTLFLYVGKIRKEKGIEHLLEAAEYLKRSEADCIFHIVGSCEESYQERIYDLHTRNIIVYHGYQKEVIPFITKAHCNILPSYHEGMSNSLQENAACGRPAIASDISGCREIIEHGYTGFLVKPKDTKDLIEKIEVFIRLPYKRKKSMGIAARKRVETFFDRTQIVNKYVARIDEVYANTCSD